MNGSGSTPDHFRRETEIGGGQRHGKPSTAVAIPTNLQQAHLDDEQQIKAVVEFARLDDISDQ